MVADASIDTFIHLTAGGIGGTTGAILTCPLEVVKTRLQSSDSGFKGMPPAGRKPPVTTGESALPTSQKSSSFSIRRLVIPPEVAAERSYQTTIPTGQKTGNRWLGPGVPWSSGETSGGKKMYNSFDSSTKVLTRFYSTTKKASRQPQEPKLNVFQCLRYIFVNEGMTGLFKGLGPNLMGVAPSRAIYFWTYSTCKSNVDAALPPSNRDTPFVHVVSAAAAGFSASTATNPIWLIKTRLQLDKSSGSNTMTIRSCAAKIYSELGIAGFWRGVTASYWGISETVIHFVVYEYLKSQLAAYQNKHKDAEKTFIDFAGFMLCGACSRTCATIVAYPHEVARTRLREEGSRFRSFWPCLIAVYKTEGRAGLYRGLVTQLIRQIPNTAIMMSTYELSVHLLTNWLKNPTVVKTRPATSSTTEESLRCKSSHSQ